MTSNSTLAGIVADHPFLSAMPVGSLRRLATHVQSVEYPARHELFREGATADRFFLIRRGVVRLDLEVAARGRLEVETLGADSALGWSWLFPPFKWQLSATAIERTRVLVFDAAVLRTLMAADPVIGYELMRRFASVIFDRLQVTRTGLSAEAAEVPRGGVVGPWAGKRTTAPSWG